MPNLGQRIIIIGAGAAGLTTAEALKQRGYTQVTVLERSHRAGGKCYSPLFMGRSYELGAGLLTENNRTALTLARRYHIQIEQLSSYGRLLLDVTTGARMPERTLLLKFRVFYQLVFRYFKLLRKYHRVTQPGLTQLDPAVCLPFTHYAQRYQVEELAQELAPYFTGFGYGYFDTVPAAYVLKYYNWATFKALALGRIYKFTNGIQSLWTAIAQQHDVRYNIAIQNIERADIITITTAAGQLECDTLIITSPLDEAVQFLDATATERQLFGKIQYCDYRTYAVWVEQFPDLTGFAPGNYDASRPGQPLFWYQRHPDLNLYTFYVLGDWQLSDEDVLKNIQHVAQQLGGRIERVQSVQHWKYFPHVSADDMRAGYFDQLESLQGQRQTYYAGELLNFSTVGLTAEYAEQLIQRFFTV